MPGPVAQPSPGTQVPSVSQPPGGVKQFPSLSSGPICLAPSSLTLPLVPFSVLACLGSMKLAGGMMPRCHHPSVSSGLQAHLLSPFMVPVPLCSISGVLGPVLDGPAHIFLSVWPLCSYLHMNRQACPWTGLAVTTRSLTLHQTCLPKSKACPC